MIPLHKYVYVDFLTFSRLYNLSNSMNKFYVIRDFIYNQPLKCSFPLEKAH